MTEDEMVGWHHRLDGHELEQALGDEGQGSLVCCSAESDITERLNSSNSAKHEAGAQQMVSLIILLYFLSVQLSECQIESFFLYSFL